MNHKLSIFLSLFLILGIITLILVGEKNLELSYSDSQIESINREVSGYLKTASEIKAEEFSTITPELLSTLKDKEINDLIYRFTVNNPIEIADGLLNNEIYVGPYWDTIIIQDPTWLEDPYGDNSWVLYYQSLDFIPYLVRAYEETNDIKYLKKAQYFIFDWIEHNREIYYSKSSWAWTDHSTPNRVLNFIQFWKRYKDSELYIEEEAKELIYSLKQHGKFIYDDNNYSPFNHGIMQDQSLLELALIFNELENSKKWEEKANKRLKTRLEEDYSESGVHKEHSPSYHRLVTDLFTNIKDFTTSYGVYDGEYDDTLKKSINYYKYLVNPRGEFPLLGDTKLEKVSTEPLKSLQEKAFLDGGVAFLRNDWNESFNPLSLVFTSAFHSEIHKHADDLSFILDYGNTDYFVDGGQYNYDNSDEYRKYMTSVFSHNTIAVNGESANLDESNIGKSQLTAFESTDNFSYVSGINKLYNDINIKRHIIYLKNAESILIHDIIESEDENNYSQIFNIGQHVNITQVDEKEFKLESTLDSTSINIKQIGASFFESIDVFEGEEDPIRGWQSFTLNEKHPVTSLHFNKQGKNESYLTLLCLDGNDLVEDVVYSEKTNGYSIHYKDGSSEQIMPPKEEVEEH